MANLFSKNFSIALIISLSLSSAKSLPHHTGGSIARNSKKAWHYSKLLANTNFKLTAAVMTVFLFFFSGINEKD